MAVRTRNFHALNIKTELYQAISVLSAELTAERGSRVSRADVIAEAIKIYKDKRQEVGAQ